MLRLTSGCRAEVAPRAFGRHDGDSGVPDRVQVQSVTESRLYKSFGRSGGGLAQAASADGRRLLQASIDARQPVVTPVYNGRNMPIPC